MNPNNDIRARIIEAGKLALMALGVGYLVRLGIDLIKSRPWRKEGDEQ